MKTAIVHDWLVSMGGAERVLQAIVSLYPSSIYTLVHDPGGFTAEGVKTSFLQKIPGAKRFYRNFLPFFPLAIEQFDLTPYDLILSSSHAVAKGVVTHKDQLHICYCHTPMRYAWDLYHHYMNDLGVVKKNIAKSILHYLRSWDVKNLDRVDHFIANSRYVADRIQRVYGKEATVIYPPIETDRLQPREQKEDFYITVGRLVSYKKVDLIVEAFAHLPDKRLVVIGDGPEMPRIRSKASKNVEILGKQPDRVTSDLLSRAKGFIFAADEDFGIAPLEAQATGTPVVAFAKGGALETITEKTGLFFPKQTVESLIDGIHRFEMTTFDPWAIRKHAEQFSRKRFEKEFKTFVEEKWLAFTARP